MPKVTRRKLLDDNAWLKDTKNATRKELPSTRALIAVNSVVDISSKPSSKPPFKNEVVHSLKPGSRTSIGETAKSSVGIMKPDSSQISTNSSPKTSDSGQMNDPARSMVPSISKIEPVPILDTKQGIIRAEANIKHGAKFKDENIAVTLDAPKPEHVLGVQTPLGQQPHFQTNLGHPLAMGPPFQIPAQAYHTYT